MNRLLQRRALLQGGLALCASLVIRPARACEYFTGGLRITHPWTRATGHATSAVVCMRFDEVTETDRLIGVESPVAADAELVVDGQGTALDLLIPQGREIVLSEGGTYVRLVGLKHPLLIARAYPLRLVFEKGGDIRALLNVDFPSPALSRGNHHP